MENPLKSIGKLEKSTVKQLPPLRTCRVGDGWGGGEGMWGRVVDDFLNLWISNGFGTPGSDLSELSELESFVMLCVL